MIKIISFGLWGDNPKYTLGAVRNSELAKDIYPDWKCKFFIGSNVPYNIVKRLEQFENNILQFKDEPNNWTSLFWRFETSYDESIDVSIFRDTDSRLSLREKNAVDEWLNSDKTFHIMRDHPWHRTKILGGMWGYKNTNKYPIQKTIASFNKQNQYGADQKCLEQLYLSIGDDKIIHDPFFDKIPFPKERVGLEFVGQVFDFVEQPDKSMVEYAHQKYYDVLKKYNRLRNLKN